MADLSGMFKQLNQAILGNPLMGDAGGKLLTMGSQGAGQALGAGMSGLTGKPVDPMTFMTGDAKKMEGEDQLGKLDLQTADGLAQASRIYAQMGDVEKSVQLATMAGDKKTKQIEALEKEGDAITAEARKKRGMAIAHGRGDAEGARAIQGGLVSAEDYYKTLFQSKVKTAETIAGRDPYANAFTKDVVMGNKVVPVRFRADGSPIAVLGEGRGDFTIEEMYDPTTGGLRQAIVSKITPGQYQWLGEGQNAQPAYEIKEVDGKFHTWMTPAGGGAPQRIGVTDTLTQAEKDMANAKSSVKTVNLMSSIDKGISMIDSVGKEFWGGVGGMSGLLELVPGTEANNFRALIDSIKANVGFESLANLRAEGGTLGQVSNIENMLLASEIAKLDTWTDAGALRASLEKIRNITERTHVAETTKNPEELFTAEKNVQGQPTGNRLYEVDENTIYVIYPDGSLEEVKQ